jgi:purine-binding chemotaxis protein CheW
VFEDGPERLLVFGVGAERFGVPLAMVDEVIDAPQTRELPDAPRSVLGITTVRGTLVTIYDPRPLLSVDGAVNEAALLFQRGTSRVGLAVQQLYDTIVVEPSELRPVPGAGSDGTDKALVGLVRRGANLIAVLDAQSLLDAAASGGEI